jgi:hypothetical protein
MLFCEQLKRVLHTQPGSYLQTEQNPLIWQLECMLLKQPGLW